MNVVNKLFLLVSLVAINTPLLPCEATQNVSDLAAALDKVKQFKKVKLYTNRSWPIEKEWCNGFTQDDIAILKKLADSKLTKVQQPEKEQKVYLKQKSDVIQAGLGILTVFASGAAIYYLATTAQGAADEDTCIMLAAIGFFGFIATIGHGVKATERAGDFYSKRVAAQHNVDILEDLANSTKQT